MSCLFLGVLRRRSGLGLP
uniref:Uncharacterized protein n=1 Tax=Anguilla anguilla TaxID=7936 RepID=A0A0E9VVQ5_ANGAN